MTNYYTYNFFFIEPGSPGGLFVNVISNTSLNVTWFRPNVTNGIIIAYEIFVYNISTSPNARSVMMNMTTNNNQTVFIHIIGELEPKKEYSVAVRAYTNIGAGNFTYNFSVWTNQSGESMR